MELSDKVLAKTPQNRFYTTRVCYCVKKMCLMVFTVGKW